MDILRTLETFPKSTCHSAVDCLSADIDHSLALPSTANSDLQELFKRGVCHAGLFIARFSERKHPILRRKS